ncbi:hypothetical protein GCM10027034_34240 [Ramlibacter solisilvae]|uniref:DUF6600 domain-containing protein n=1 Tax=Ramlibacter tataouinensis TaxID=94132 RepID=UPI000776D50C|nr:DUF6600 domain-containing protein [Ramlibacter tataouinensis]
MGRLLPFIVRWCTLALVTVGGSAMAQVEPPARVARLNHVEGRVMFAPAGAAEWGAAEPNRPLVRGDRLWAEQGTRAEIQVGSAVLRIDGGTRLEVRALADDTAQLGVTEGSVQLRVRSLPEGENFEIDTPQLAYRVAYPGEARIDVDRAQGRTRVTVSSGAGAVFGERGQTLPLGGGQQLTFSGRGLERVAQRQTRAPDNFDRWVAERTRRDAQSLAARYLPRELVGYQSLDDNGQWGQDPAFGTVWFPNARADDWAPYRHGRWAWIAPWGWTWIDEAPWAFATSHYGRWALVGARWAWVPGRLPLRPAYAPALVAFVGDAGAAALSLGGKASVAWFPLAPGEPWQPGGRSEGPYVGVVNLHTKPPPANGYAYQRRPEAVTAIAAADFTLGKPRAGRLAVNDTVLARAQVVAPPPALERATDPAQLPAQSAQARKAEQEQAARQQEQQRVQAAEQARAQQAAAERDQAQSKAEQAKAAQAKAQQAKEEQAKAASARAEQAKAEQARAQQAASTQAQVRAQQAKAEQAKAEQARAQQVAVERAAAQAKTDKAKTEKARAEQAKAEQAKAKKMQQAQASPPKPKPAAAAARPEPVAKRETPAARASPPAPRAVPAAKKPPEEPSAHAQNVEAARRAAERDAQLLRAQLEEAERRRAQQERLRGGAGRPPQGQSG